MTKEKTIEKWLEKNYIMIIGILLFIMNMYAGFYQYIETGIGYSSLYHNQGLILLILCYLMYKNKQKELK